VQINVEEAHLLARRLVVDAEEAHVGMPRVEVLDLNKDEREQLLVNLERDLHDVVEREVLPDGLRINAVVPLHPQVGVVRGVVSVNLDRTPPPLGGSRQIAASSLLLELRKHLDVLLASLPALLEQRIDEALNVLRRAAHARRGAVRGPRTPSEKGRDLRVSEASAKTTS
jgi:hypothetical protein